jgi:hypothetical protein
LVAFPRRAALARLAAEELADAVSDLRTSSLSKPELERALELVEALSARVQKALDLPGARRLPPSFTTATCWGKSGRARALRSCGRAS